MGKESNKYGVDVIDLKNILGVFKKRKWLFIGTFLIILVAGLTFNFFIAADYQYKASTMLTLSTNNLKYQQIISDEYPQEASSLWLMEEGRPTNNFFNHRLRVITLEVHSEDFLNKVKSNLETDIALSKLKRLVVTDHKGNDHFFVINTFADSPENAINLNEILIDTYISHKEESFANVYEGLVTEVRSEVSSLETELAALSQEAEEYAKAFNQDLLEEINVEDNLSIELKATGFLTPELENRIKIVTDRHNYLSRILNNLQNNEEFYTSSLEIVGSTIVDRNYTYFRNILLSIVAAVVMGIIVVYITDFIISTTNKKSKQ